MSVFSHVSCQFIFFISSRMLSILLRSDTVSTQTWVLYAGSFLELSFSKSGGVHHSYTFQCGLVGSFTSPGIAIDARYKGPTALSVSSERHWQSGVNGIAKVPKQSFPQWDSNPIRTVRSPAQANALTHSATAPSTPSRPPRPQSYSRPGRPLLLFPGANVHSSTKLVVLVGLVPVLLYWLVATVPAKTQHCKCNLNWLFGS